MYNKLNFAIWENTYKRFQKEDKPDILIGMMRLSGIGITLTQVKQNVIFDKFYNACSSNQVEKRISRI